MKRAQFKTFAIRILAIYIAFVAITVEAEERVRTGAIVKHIGDVLLYPKPATSGIRLEKPKEWIFVDNQLQSSTKSKAYIKLADGSKLLMRDNAQIHLLGERSLSVTNGKVLFSIAKRKLFQEPFNVTTRVANLGIRGTQFLIEENQNEQDNALNVYLKEGDITVLPLENQFKLFRKKERDEFESFKKKEQTEFQAFKDKEEEEFVGFISEYKMQANKGISISGDELREVSIPTQARELFDELNDPAFDQ